MHTRSTYDARSPSELDTGFIVHNEVELPAADRALPRARRRDAAVRDVVRDVLRRLRPRVLEQAAAGVPGRLLREILRFQRTRRARPTRDGKSFDRFSRDEGYSESFRRHYLVPMSSALWSMAPREALDFPASLRGSSSSPTTRCSACAAAAGAPSPAAAATYVRALLERLGGRCTSDAGALIAARRTTASRSATGDGEPRRFDAVVVATSAPTGARPARGPVGRGARDPLAPSRRPPTRPCSTPTPRFLPRSPANRSSWNYRSPAAAPTPTARRSPTRSTGCSGSTRRASTASRSTATADIDAGTVIARSHYEHPAGHVREPRRRSASCRRYGAERHTAFAGAWQGYGFHEDGLASGLRAAPRRRSVSRMTPNSALYTGTVMHARRSPRDNVFRYPSPTWARRRPRWTS